ncbi:hypothetical protein CK203_011616 [Vitis vinifera]|uniref:H15 domain-containing protein n=1 Tax=Vitis vinifera TaxID=29760 RepID=A0A438JUK9_VITVI|nr:hypothetical protein CK203_011616 [Vitis vinifera]
MRLTKDDSEVNLASGEAEPEFSEWKWSNPEEVIEQLRHCLRKQEVHRKASSPVIPRDPNPDHPPYAWMILDAIKTLKEKGNGDIVVTSDDHYMIPTGNPNPKRKESSRSGSVIRVGDAVDYQVNEGKNQSQGQQNEVRSELLQSSCLNDDNCAALMVIPVESSSPRAEDEGEESVEELPKQQIGGRAV